MNKHIAVPLRLAVMVAALCWNVDPPRAQTAMPPGCGNGQMRCVTNADREAAADRAKAARDAIGGRAPMLAPPGPGGVPDYFGIYPNFANSPFPARSCSVTTTQSCWADVNCPIGETCVTSTQTFCSLNLAKACASDADCAGGGGVCKLRNGVRKFVDTLPGLTAANANNLGNYLPLATKDSSTFGGADYYEIGLRDYTQKMHSDLPPTKLRGYRDLKATGADANPHYLGPVILAHRGRPTRITFKNELGAGAAGNLFLPVDTTIMGAGDAVHDGNGNPCDPAVASCVTSSYTQNRAVLHLHGGDTPWISDGTPHQWITPAGETSPLKKGVSQQNVPDMWFDSAGNVFATSAAGRTNNPGAGRATYYYPNGQSGRLMFYHDHSYGITRLNVYAGEAAGYLLYDDVEDNLITTGRIPGATMPAVYRYGIPLIIQDKTFVDATQIANQDPTWNSGSTPPTPKTGDLWFPHVYMPNQNPFDSSGANAMGRWDYGPWFWPPYTGLVNGPVPNPYAALDEPEEIPGTPNPSLVPEAFVDTPIVNGQAYPTLPVSRKAYRFRILNAANDRALNLQLYFATNAAGQVCNNPGVTGCTEVAMVPAAPHTVTCSSPGAAAPPNCWPDTWPTDGRDGGVPDPTTAGPNMIQIGTEGGLLPAPVELPNTPVGYNYNRRDIVVLNVSNHTLFLGPAERADVIVDFSGVPAGSKIVLYNDAPAPVPAFDTRFDYYTGDPDQTDTGGAPSTRPGYGPNTRTVMRFDVDSSAPDTSFSLTALQTALPAAFAASQPPPHVPEAFFGSGQGNSGAYNQSYPNTYARIQDNYVTFTPVDASGNPTGVPQTTYLQPKAIQELFTVDYGRMNATLGVELPNTNVTVQTTIPYGFVDPPTEVVQSGETQLWKITHNGVDTHAIHFHLMNVQILNRVGWDGAIRPPDPNEIGWKETVRMNPLEDVIVAVQLKIPSVPFAMPNSVRPLDVTAGVNTTGLQFTNVDPTTGNPVTVTNAMTDFGNEYVWHCHLLGHEENDMMRPIVVRPTTSAPAAPTTLVATYDTQTTTQHQVKLAWTNNGTAATSIRIDRATGAGAFSTIATLAGGYPFPSTYTDQVFIPNQQFRYQVYAINSVGPSTASNIASVNTPMWPPASGVTVTPSKASPQLVGTPVTFTAVATGSGGYQYRFSLSSDGGATYSVVQAYSTAAAWVMPGTQPAGSYVVRAEVRTSTLVNADVSGTVAFVISSPTPPGPATGVTLTASLASPQAPGTAVLFTAAGQGSSGYQYQFWFNSGAGWSIVQDYGTASTWIMPTTLGAGTYQISVHVRTSSTVPYDAWATVSFVLAPTIVPATGVTVVPDKASPQPRGTPVIFTATGSGSSGYQYQFWVSANNGGAWTLVQDYSAASTWAMPSSTAAGNYLISVHVRTSPAVAYDAWATVSYVLSAIAGPATGVTLTSSVPSPQSPGTPVVFTAAGQGSSGYQYQFWFNAGAGWSIVQDYAATASWSLPTTMPAGTYQVSVHVRTNSAVAYDAWTTVTFVLASTIAPATGVTLLPSLASPQLHGTAVTFTAAGAGSSGYQYQFWLSTNGGTSWSIVQDYSTVATWALPTAEPAGAYQVSVHVRTSSAVPYDAWNTVSYVLQ